MKYLCVGLLMLAFLIHAPPDLNNDGKVNAIDCTMVCWFLQGKYQLTPVQQIRADVNNDFRVDQKDIDLMVDQILKR